MEGRASMVEKPTFEKIVSENTSFVRRTLGQLGVPTRCLADVEQEVYRGVYRGLPAFDPALAVQPEAAIRSWLFGICERQAANHRRSEIRRGEILVSVDELDTAGDAPSTEDSLIEEERKALLHRLLATLEPRRRAVVVAYELEGIPMNEVAAAIGIPVNTAWNRLRLAREDLRQAWSRLAAQRSSAPRSAGNARPHTLMKRAVVESQAARGGAIPPLAFILGPAAFSVDPAAPFWLKVPVVKAALAFGTFAGASATAAGVALALMASPTGGPLRSAPMNEPALAAANPAPPGESASPEDIEAPGDSALSGSAPSGSAISDDLVPLGDSRSAALGGGVSGRRSVGAPLATKGGASSVDVALKAEVAELKAATDAFEDGDARLAIRLLSVHERAFPDGRMAQERELLRLRALMSEGRRNEARDCARRYLAAHPNSAGRSAIEATVGGL